MRSEDNTHHPSPVTHHSSPLTLDIFLLVFVLNLALQPPVEPDFGWHLRNGLDLLEQGLRVPATDPYSHTMPDWPWVNHAWGTDALIGWLYGGLGQAGSLGVILFFASVTAAAFLVSAGQARAGSTSRLLAVSGALWVALPFLGTRTQLVTLLGLAVTLRCFDLYRAGRVSSLWGLPPLFLLWANLHGGFTAGLFVLGLFVVAAVIVQLLLVRWPALASRLDEPALTWPQIAHLALVLVAASAATLVNPYGWRLHGEIFSSLTDKLMIQTLHEWQPVSLGNRAGATYVGYLIALGLAVAGLYRRIEPLRWTVLLVFLALSLRHWRNLLFFLLLSVPLWAELLGEAARRVSARIGEPRAQKRWLLAATVAAALVIASLGPDHLERVLLAGLEPEAYFKTTDYPIEAVQWIKGHREQVGTKLYNDYGLGGFLLWWLPEEKIFIDGRMPAWRIGDRWIFYDYVALTAWDPPELRVLDKYGVDWAIVGRNTLLDDTLAQEPAWREVYGDPKVTIFVRRK
ncbi:MAG: hypothetical protein AB1411_01690 [Nitrospirota bacterium]